MVLQNRVRTKKQTRGEGGMTADFTLYNMDVLKALQQIKPESVDCCITSPPYWGLRDYGVTGQIGLEEHPQQYIDKIVQVFATVRKVLKPTGSLWLNMGDTYFAKRTKDETTDEYYGEGRNGGHPRSMETDGSKWLQAKQKMLMPHRTAIALQEDGWILRNDIVWHKPSHMPSSVKDRLTNSFEYVFHFVIQKKYYYDLDAIREPHTTSTLNRNQYGRNPSGDDQPIKSAFSRSWKAGEIANPAGKNPGDFWAINPKPYPEAHFACYPPALVEKPLKATCPKQICTKCGFVKERITSKSYENTRPGNNTGTGKCGKEADPNKLLHQSDISKFRQKILYNTEGWTSCQCNAGFQPGTVLDPFVGSGTTLFVAQELGLRGIGIEINPEYIPLIKKRLLGDQHQTSLNPTKMEVIT